MPDPSAILTADSPPQLLVSRHRATRELRFPPLAAQSPLAAEHETVAIAGRGHVYSFTVIHPNPKSGAAPFALGYVDLPGPVRLFGRIGGEGVGIGAACEVVAHAEFGYAFQTVAA
ncbi:Zn-ribbon domain-containing OB-fold protein [Ramlibacter albus]|uniref:OB-fold domain-containing protein n=1 Tax=Ramlibacter albus TaxID=2079448 RepID=A0A923MEN6_9BURK|nr:OB-fold domain-containing protein [Ramlibacter albus]MBC5768191.1 OB-fold domain-containing protein [Ramlibacter albus]